MLYTIYIYIYKSDVYDYVVQVLLQSPYCLKVVHRVTWAHGSYSIIAINSSIAHPGFFVRPKTLHVFQILLIWGSVLG